MAIGLALLVSADPVTVHLFNQALRELSLSSEICQEVPAAIGLLKRRKFDAVIVDLQLGEPSAVILDEVHRSSSNGTAVTFGIVSNDAEGTAFRKRSDFAFDRPLSAKSIRNILKPAYGLILRERRRYFRCPVSVPVVIQRESGKEVRCNSINISGGGIALSTFILLVPGESVQIQFTLPDHTEPFLVASTICWAKTGSAGVRFISMSDDHKSELQVWLSRKLEEMLPESVAGQFRQLGASVDTSGRATKA
jgi:hypothetical protein